LRADRGGDDEKNCDARYGLDLLSLCGRICEEEGRDRITEDDVRQAQRLADMMLVYRAVSELTSSQKLLLYAIYMTKDMSPTTIYGGYNRLISNGMNGSKLTTRWLSILAQELELLGSLIFTGRDGDAGAEPILLFSRRCRLTGNTWSKRHVDGRVKRLLVSNIA
jgi:Cdc6-like AAA superfamily ATPase